MGSSVQLIPLGIVALLFLILILSGLKGKFLSATEYGFQGSYTGRVGSGAAIASNWMSAASILGLAGLFYLKGYYAMAFVIGWTGGYILLLVLMATQIRRFGKYTAPDFVGFRYESGSARTLVALISIAISVIYCIAQFRGIALLMGWLFGLDYHSAVISGAALLVLFVVVSGTLGVVKNQRLQYVVLIAAFIIPLMVLNYRLHYFWLLPQFGYGQAITTLQEQFGFYWSEPFASISLYRWLALCITLMFGTCGLPHVLARFYLAPSMSDARWGVVWGLFFISLIYWSAPAYGVLARLFDARAGTVFKVPNPATADLVTLSAVTQAGLPPVVIGLLVAGGMAAAFYASSGLLQSGASVVAHDLYPRLIRRDVTDSEKVAVAKGMFLVLAGVVMLLTLSQEGLIAEIAAVAFALAGNTLFPAFFLGIWWSRTNAYGVIAGMLTGVSVSVASALFGSSIPLLSQLFPTTASAFLGAPLVMLVMIVVSLLTAPPSDTIVSFLVNDVHDSGVK